jgi:hypothetical protein
MGYNPNTLVAKEARATFQKQPDAFDLVITDFAMPLFRTGSLRRRIVHFAAMTFAPLVFGIF